MIHLHQVSASAEQLAECHKLKCILDQNGGFQRSYAHFCLFLSQTWPVWSPSNKDHSRHSVWPYALLSKSLDPSLGSCQELFLILSCISA
jgi:hypothetical protein